MSSGGSNNQNNQQQQQQQQQNQQQQQQYYYGTIPSSNSRHSRESATSNSLNVPVEEVRVRTRTINTETQPLLLGGGILGSQASTATTVIFDDVSSVQHDSDIETNNPGQQQHYSRYNNKKKARINKNKYVEANDDQRSLLRYMDEVIELSKKKSTTTTTTTRNNNKNNGTRNNESSSSGNSGNSGSGGSGGIYAEIPSITLAEIKETSSMLIRRSSSSSCCCGRCMSSFCALQVPFVTFVATISIAIGIIYLLDRKFLDDIIVQLLPSTTTTNNIEDFKESIHELETSYYEPFMLFVLPALTLVLGMVGAITPISTMLFASFSENLCYHTNPDVIKQATLDSVEHVIINVAGHIDKVNIRLSLILDDMKPMCQKSVQYINKLLALDPNLLEQATIPSNPTTFILVKERLCDSKDELRQCVLQFEQEIDSSSEDDNNNNDDNNIVKSWIPSHLHSSEVYRHSATCQTMTVLFVLQCLGIVGTFFLLSLYLPFDDDDYDATQEMIDGSITTSLTSIGALLSINLDSVSTAIHNYVPLTNNLTIVTYTWILIYALVSYLITMVVILVVKITGQTSHTKMLRIVNDVRSKASQQTNLLLKQYGIIFLCQDILQTRVERAKLKLLKLIHTQLKLEMLWSIIDQQQQFEAAAAAASSSNSNINNTSSSIWRTPISPKKPTTTTSSLSPKRSSTAAATTTTATYTGDSIADRFSKIKSYWRPPQQQHDQETTTTTTTMMAASGVHQPPPVSPTRNHPTTTTTTGTTMTSSGGGSSHSPPPPVSPTRNLLSSYWPSKSQQQQQQQQQHSHEHDDAADEEQHSAASSSSKLQRRTSTHDEEMATGTEKPTVPRR